MDQAAASSLAGLHARDYNKYQIPASAKIKRKPLAPSHYSSLTTLREEDDEITEMRNPLSALSKSSFQITPDNISPRSTGATTVVGDESPKQLPAHLTRRLKRRDASRRGLGSEFFEYWALDILWLVISLCCLVVIIVVLHAFDGIGVAELPMMVTLNVFLAFMTTLAKASFMIPVAEAISQWKWSWFREERPLSDFQIFDDASRGFLGSVFLLRHLNYKHIASIGAIISVLTLFTSPVTQLLINYPEGLIQVEDGTAIAQATRTLKDYQSNPLAPWETDLQRAIMNGMSRPLDSPAEPLGPNCTSSDCTFPKFQSLGLCMKIANVTQLLNVTEGPTAAGSSPRAANQTTAVASLPPVANCQLRTGWSNSVVTCKADGTHSLSFGRDESLRRSTIYSMPIIYSNPGNASDDGHNGTTATPSQFQALEVLFHLCVQSYEIRTGGGSTATIATDLPPVIAASSADQVLDINCTMPAEGLSSVGCTSNGTGLENLYLQLVNNAVHNAASPPEYFMAEMRTLKTLALELNSMMSGLWEWNGLSFDANDQNMVGAREVQAVGNAIYGGSTDPTDQFDRVSKLMKNVATSVTNAIRSISQQTSGNGTQVNSILIQGTPWSRETIIRIQWGWLALLTFQFVLAAAFLIATVVLTHKEKGQVLKSSALGLLFALGEDCRQVAGGLESVPAMRRKARVLLGRLDGNNVELSGPAQRSPGRTRSTESTDSGIEKANGTTVVLKERV